MFCSAKSTNIHKIIADYYLTKNPNTLTAPCQIQSIQGNVINPWYVAGTHQSINKKEQMGGKDINVFVGS